LYYLDAYINLISKYYRKTIQKWILLSEVLVFEQMTIKKSNIIKLRKILIFLGLQCIIIYDNTLKIAKNLNKITTQRVDNGTVILI
jgi:hypothetical protein